MAWFEKKQPSEVSQEPAPVSSDPARENLYSGPEEHSELDKILSQLAAQQQPEPPEVAPSAPETQGDIPPESAKNTPTATEQPRKRRGSSGRHRQIKFRVTPEEYARIHQRVEKSGLRQGDFLRQAALTERIILPQIDPVMLQIDDNLEYLVAELGRQGGMLKMVVKPNKGQRELNPQEWEDLVHAIRNLQYAQTELAKIRETLYGNRQA